PAGAPPRAVRGGGRRQPLPRHPPGGPDPDLGVTPFRGGEPGPEPPQLHGGGDRRQRGHRSRPRAAVEPSGRPPPTRHLPRGVRVPRLSGDDRPVRRDEVAAGGLPPTAPPPGTSWSARVGGWRRPPG